MAKVVVVGAGVIGVTTALAILEADPSIKLTVIAEKFSPNTTSDGAAGEIMPFAMGNTPMDLQRKWFGTTMKKYETLLRSDKAEELGIFLASGFEVFGDYIAEEPDWKDLVYSFRRMTDKELSDFPVQPAKSGFSYLTIIAQGAYFIPWLMDKVKDLGGSFVQKKISSLTELLDYDVVVNCTGISARELVGDNLVEPIRGQVLRVKAPSVKHSFSYITKELENQGQCCYIHPQTDSVVIGGIKHYNSYNDKPTLEDTVSIISGVSKIIPSLKKAPILKNWAGLRPGRCTVRLEKEAMKFTDVQGVERTLNVVHNYGHGGSGLSVGFGCAVDCRDLVLEVLAGKMKAKL